MSKDGTKTVVAIVLALAIGGGALAYGGFQLQKVREIESGPTVVASGTVWQLAPSRGRTTHRVKYEFVRGGSVHTGGWARVSKDVHDRVSAGAPLLIRSAPERPGWNLPEEAIAGARSDAMFTIYTGALVLVFVLTALVLMWAAKRRKAKTAARAAPPPADNFPKDPPTGSP